ncbi:MAG TPA: hypothetical protein VHB79_37530 [Polyangiaceae bacterium]|nr:hypothetical protein [Polyangiaceae bacterium]
MSSKALRVVVLGGLAAAAACDPNVLIGERWHVAGGAAGQAAVAGTTAVAGGGSSAGTEATAGGSAEAGEPAMAGAPGASGEAGAAGAAAVEPPQWCATAPWKNTPVTFTSDEVGNVIPAGSYTITYMGGAQIHDASIGYEVTGHYIRNGIMAGHHIFSGASPETGATQLWLDDTGLVTGGTIAHIEATNFEHTWALEHHGGELAITLYDDVYDDNQGPGSKFCITPAKP